MLSDENDNFVRDYEVMYDMTLAEFHEFLRESLGYEEGMVSFFTADDRWERQREYTLMDMGETDAQPMDSVVLGQLMHRLRDRLIYVFDMFGNRAYYLELTEAHEADKDMVYPRVLFEHGTAPDQYDPEASEGDDRSIFEEMMGEFDDFEGDDSYDDDQY